MNDKNRKGAIEFVVCGPGMYFGQIPATRNVHLAYCPQGIEACVPCPGNKLKTVLGNEQSLCVDCDQENTVPNSDQTGCGKCG